MKHSQAVEMLSHRHLNNSEKQIWADLGSGTGTFTLALAHLLVPDSRIIAVDKESRSLNQIPEQFQQVVIKKRMTDFTGEDFPSANLDGILMANSLHYVQNQEDFINKIKKWLKPAGLILIVEYDMDSPNPWVPYPVSFVRLDKLFKNSGFTSIQKLKEKPSRYNRSNLYSAMIQHQESGF